MNGRVKRAADGLWELLYPKRAVCMGCGDMSGLERDWLCEACRQKLAKDWIGAHNVSPGTLDGAAFAFHYAGPAGGIVRHMKYNGVKRLAPMMCDAMARAFEAIQPTGAEWVVPVPMHPKRARERCFNHSELLARGVAERTGLQCVNALSRTRNTAQQARLTDDERRANLKDAFACGVSPEGRRVLLVDDVYTTGTTARSCAEALRGGGAKNVYLLCFALAKREDGG